MYKQLLDKIIENPVITIFRHQRPDGDAAGAQLALSCWIKDNFPAKKVYVLGNIAYDVYPYIDEAEDEDIKNSLAIILDTANTDRIDDERALNARYLVKIDHHPNNDPYGQINIVDTKAGSTCEILTEILLSFDGYLISENCATFLYSGILTDTLGFRTTNTSSKTLYLASKLAEKGINISDISQKVFEKTQKELEMTRYILEKLQIIGNFAYSVIPFEANRIYNTSGWIFRNQIQVLNGIKEFEIWAVFTEDEPGIYSASLRSKSVKVNDIAMRYRGGGHDHAAGIKGLSRGELDQLIAEIITILTGGNHEQERTS